MEDIIVDEPAPTSIRSRTQKGFAAAVQDAT